MNRDPAKRITAFGIGVHKGEVRAVLVVNDAQTLVVASNCLTHSQAELLCDGCVDGLRECADLPSHLIDAFLDDQNAVELGSPPSKHHWISKKIPALPTSPGQEPRTPAVEGAQPYMPADAISNQCRPC